jgi:hypothetical protein
MHRVGSGGERGPHHGVDPQVGLGGRRPGQPHSQVGLGGVRRVLVGVGEHRHRADAQLTARAEDPPGDLPTVGHQQPLDRLHHNPAHIRKTP